MRVHCLQHVPYEGPGRIVPWLRARGCQLTRTRLWETDALPEPATVDFLVVMGGPMSVNDHDEHPWLAAEKALVRRLIEDGKAVLGVCLGAQMIASAMGADVYPAAEKEIGWFPIEGLDAAPGAKVRFPKSVEVFHWHGETFDLPAGAVRLARSEVCENQAFQLGRSVVGLQFHLETTPEGVRDMVEHGRGELRPGRYVQSETAMLGGPPERYRALGSLLADVLAGLTGKHA